MKDREKTALLTKIGFLWLTKLGCTCVAPEVHIITHGLRDYNNELANHQYIDLVGVSEKYLPEDKRYKETKVYTRVDGSLREYEYTVDKETVTRGIEIKVSKSDFRNGFIHVGCDYHYLMIPKGLVTKKEVTKDIGIIEVDLEKVKICLNRRHGFTEYWLEGVNQIRKPRRQKLYPTSNDYVLSQMAYCLTGYLKLHLREEMGVRV